MFCEGFQHAVYLVELVLGLRSWPTGLKHLFGIYQSNGVASQKCGQPFLCPSGPRVNFLPIKRGIGDAIRRSILDNSAFLKPLFFFLLLSRRVIIRI